MKRQFLFFAAILVSIVFAGASVHSAGKRYALIVGVKTYRPGQPLPELSYTENDATGLSKALKAGGYQVTLMTQTVARTKGREVFAPLSDYIRDQADALLSNPNLRDEDVVIVAFAGHGVQFDYVGGTADNKTKISRFYFCPADANIAKLRNANGITDRNRLLDLAEIYESLKQCKAGGKLLLVDACRNDPTKPAFTRGLASATLPPLPPPPGGTAAFFSCSANQRAFEDKDLKHGVFFHHVIEALKGQADLGSPTRPADGRITVSELRQHVSGETYDFVREKYNGARQTPELKGEFRLSVPLIELKPALSKPLPKMKLGRTSPSQLEILSPTVIENAGGVTSIRIRALSNPDDSIVKFTLYHNKTRIPDEEFTVDVRNRTGEILHEWKMKPPDKENTYFVRVYTRQTHFDSQEINVNQSAATAGLQSTHDRNLFVLSIGISDYADSSNDDRDFAHTDARQIAATFTKYAQPLYKSVQTRVLENRQATNQKITESLKWMRSKMSPDDVGLIYYAGHGGDVGSEYHFFPADTAVDKQNGISARSLFAQLEQGRAERFIFLLDAASSSAEFGPDLIGVGLGGAEHSLTSLLKKKCNEHPQWTGLTWPRRESKTREDQRFRQGHFATAVIQSLSNKTEFDDKLEVTTLKGLCKRVSAYIKQIADRSEENIEVVPYNGVSPQQNDVPLTKP